MFYRKAQGGAAAITDLVIKKRKPAGSGWRTFKQYSLFSYTFNITDVGLESFNLGTLTIFLPSTDGNYNGYITINAYVNEVGTVAEALVLIAEKLNAQFSTFGKFSTDGVTLYLTNCPFAELDCNIYVDFQVAP